MILNLQDILDRVDGDMEMLQEIINVFLATAPELLSKVKEALSQENALAVQETAHRLKGAVGNFSSQGPYHTVQELENLGKEGKFKDSSEVLKRLESEIGQIESQLRALAGREEA